MDADDKKMTTSATTYLRMKWNDERLRHNMGQILLTNDDTGELFRRVYATLNLVLFVG